MTGVILRRLKNEIAPLINHNSATFVWRGRAAPKLTGDFTGWDEGTPVRLVKSEPGVWTYQLNLPADAYIEYGFIHSEEVETDPLNPRRTSNGVGGYNSYFGMPEYKPTELTRNLRSTHHGKISQHYLPTDYLIAGEERLIYLYQPPVNEPVPLVVVWDGYEFLKTVRLNYMVDNLITQHRIQPIALAFVTNHDQRSRTSEYACNEATLFFLISEVLPLARSELNLLDFRAYPGEYGVIGASMGGLMALFSSARQPQIFGKVLSQSGAFLFDGFEMGVFDLLNQPERRPLKVWMDVGVYDVPGLRDANRQMRDVLINRGYSLTYHEYNAGHNYPAWRDDIWRGLETLFGST